ncbi:MAG: gamma-glutamylcyclotransferase [Muricauda sp.]|nr:gamma-glutamylcyclotransferase family protein [Allomuricauda sp.]MBO6531787.1 gamma-glutamylcyclotransferase [Allomuricauda sp.]MBO6588319.1 gamma-glutamylcyclotransferase [Allomuricauda sp.]MBO6617944.1 gamma-glutamylcyclotransferase [Allomuricauda sp.]MBO6643045.1 gamma-glutamylcyclotransferase [Allomuricauda sp.]MBO6746279.1 gamma-glutamylcyclotransferase [Allomuricauda sp.]
MEYLFSYGTLQDPQVQESVFGRWLNGKTDAVTGFQKMENAVYGRYPIVAHTGNPKHKVKGMAYEVSAVDLKKADRYETEAYKRELFTLESGAKAWIYVENSN